MGSIMIEENVVSAAGTAFRLDVDDFCRLIRSAGKRPVQRDTLYRRVRANDDGSARLSSVTSFAVAIQTVFEGGQSELPHAVVVSAACA